VTARDEVARALVERYGPQAHPSACVTLRCEEIPGLVDVVRHSDAILIAIRAAAPDLTFYKSVGQKNSDAQLTAAAAKDQPADNTSAAQDSTAAPRDPAQVPPVNGYFVQVAAVSKQEDAEALVEALKKKQYPAFALNSSPDKLFHVQVGPYSDIKEAEGMRTKLVSDGYNPILKK